MTGRRRLLLTGKNLLWGRLSWLDGILARQLSADSSTVWFCYRSELG